MSKVTIKSDEFEAALAQNLQMLRPRLPSKSSNRRRHIICLGESHGSHLFALRSDVLPATGALLLRLPEFGDHDVLIDPGWGTIVSSKRLNVSVAGVKTILVSHCHLDHIGDLHPLLLTLSLAGKRPVVVGNSTSIKGSRGQPSILPQYFRNLCEKIIVARPQQLVRLGPITVLPFATAHRENLGRLGQSLGYVVAIRQKQPTRIGIVTDGPLGSLPESVLSRLRKCGDLVVNIGTISTLPNSPSHSKVFDNALCFHGLELFLRKLSAKPHHVRRISVTHLGAELLEIRARSLKRLLARTESKDLLVLIEANLRSMVRATLGSSVKTNILREGDKLEV